MYHAPEKSPHRMPFPKDWFPYFAQHVAGEHRGDKVYKFKVAQREIILDIYFIETFVVL